MPVIRGSGASFWPRLTTTSSGVDLDFSYLYHYKRYADENLDDDDPDATSGPFILYDSLPICLMRVEMLGLGVGPVSELPIAPAPPEVLRSPAALPTPAGEIA